MVDHVANRDRIIEEIRRELVGPAPVGDPIEIKPGMRIDDWKKFEGPYFQIDTGEEILTKDTPSTRYGIGVLYPQQTDEPEESAVLETASALIDSETIDEMPDAELDKWASKKPKYHPSKPQGEPEDQFDLSKANSLKPSTMAVSFQACLPEDSSLEIMATGGRYVRHTVEVVSKGKVVERVWWLRNQVKLSGIIPATRLLGSESQYVKISASDEMAIGSKNVEPLDLKLEVLSRPTNDKEIRLLTVSLVNRSVESHHNLANEKTLFQAGFITSVRTMSGEASILPYPLPPPKNDPEQLGQEMLYRNIPIFGTGHGCSADWGYESTANRATFVRAECLPEVELKPITPEIRLEDETTISISMKELARLEPLSNVWVELEALIARYEEWIAGKVLESSETTFPTMYNRSAEEHLTACRDAAQRMKKGLAYLEENPDALRAFRYANEAMYVQQLASRAEARQVTFDPKTEKLVVAGAYISPFKMKAGANHGNWRPFQIAFLLASVSSAGDPFAGDRDTVDLIWFPTGGGKTEAYLGLAAYSMFLRRLRNPRDAGVNVIMRYTLRLLTTQQFERAASLVCAMEEIRRQEGTGLGDEEFSIGVWVGGETTPNSRAQAVTELEELKKAWDAENPFLINKCAWCGALLGPVQARIGKKRKTFTPGYKIVTTSGNVDTVSIRCPDSTCPFSNGLPLYVIDEDIYEYRPSIVIGTIDKFANLAWRSEARSIFGLDEKGVRTASPPQLIIQDELHLITGPLGSLAGLFEPVIENLCSDDREGTIVRPKIVCATATTRRFREQILGLYGRKHARLFPPPGINADNSFFAQQDAKASGKKYLGIHAPGFGSYQTEWVRALSALIHAPMHVDQDERDPWWTLLLFCNSLRDMGTAHTLLDTDVRDYSQVYWNRNGTAKHKKRYLSDIQELTGGLKRSQIREAIDALEAGYPPTNKNYPVDVCLATNIIEVGVDIPRLSLMAVAGQPKTTAQYIQATGRVGRNPEKPGLVLTLYGPSKPRDRSHFERFRGYHERLYAQVEPSSVTPFSSPALQRALHAAIVAFVRQRGGPQVAASPYPPPHNLIDEAIRIIRERAKLVDPLELETFDRISAQRNDEWTRWEKLHWDKADGEDLPLLRTAGAFARSAEEDVSWSTMRSMRNVDSECHGWISDEYNRQPTMVPGANDD